MGCDWLKDFMPRHHLSNRNPEATPIARDSAFKKNVIREFFDSFPDVLHRLNQRFVL